MNELHEILVYGTDAIIPVEVGLSTHRIDMFSQVGNDEMRREELDLVYERRENAHERLQKSNEAIKAAYDRRVSQRRFQVGDLVLR